MCDNSGRGHALHWGVESPAALTTTLGSLAGAVCFDPPAVRDTDGAVMQPATSMTLWRAAAVSYTLWPTHFSAAGPTTVRLELAQPVAAASGGVNLALTASGGAALSTPLLQLLPGQSHAEFEFTPAGGQTTSQLAVSVVTTQRPSAVGYFSLAGNCPVLHSVPPASGQSFTVSAWIKATGDTPQYFISQGSGSGNGLEWAMGTDGGMHVQFDFWGSNQGQAQQQPQQQAQRADAHSLSLSLSLSLSEWIA